MKKLTNILLLFILITAAIVACDKQDNIAFEELASEETLLTDEDEMLLSEQAFSSKTPSSSRTTYGDWRDDAIAQSTRNGNGTPWDLQVWLNGYGLHYWNNPWNNPEWMTSKPNGASGLGWDSPYRSPAFLFRDTITGNSAAIMVNKITGNAHLIDLSETEIGSWNNGTTAIRIYTPFTEGLGIPLSNAIKLQFLTTSLHYASSDAAASFTYKGYEFTREPANEWIINRLNRLHGSHIEGREFTAFYWRANAEHDGWKNQFGFTLMFDTATGERIQGHLSRVFITDPNDGSFVSRGWATGGPGYWCDPSDDHSGNGDCYNYNLLYMFNILAGQNVFIDNYEEYIENQ